MIARELYIPHISSDLINSGIRLSELAEHDRGYTLFHVFLPLIKTLAQKNVSIVVDQVLLKAKSREDILQKIEPHAEIVNVHAICSDPVSRYEARERSRTDRGVYLPWEDHQVIIEKHRQRLGEMQSPLSLKYPQIVVNTDKGYEPTFEKVIQFIDDNYPLLLEGEI